MRWQFDLLDWLMAMEYTPDLHPHASRPGFLEEVTLALLYIRDTRASGRISIRNAERFGLAHLYFDTARPEELVRQALNQERRQQFMQSTQRTVESVRQVAEAAQDVARQGALRGDQAPAPSTGGLGEGQ